MHLSAGELERIDDGGAAVDLDQSPGAIVFLSAADSELAAFAEAAGRTAGAPSIRVANWTRLIHPYSVDLYIEKTLSKAELVIVRLMGGAGYWPYGLEAIRALARGGGPKLVVVPGDDRWDLALEAYSSFPAEATRPIWRCLVEGGASNFDRALGWALHRTGRGAPPDEAEALPVAGFYRPGSGAVPMAEALSRSGLPVALLVFYRALIEGGSTEPVDAMIAALAERGIAAVAVFVASLKHEVAADVVRVACERFAPAIVLNGTAFAIGAPGREHVTTVLDAPGRPVLQIVFAGSSRAAWAASARGLGPRDMIMNVVLPEVDGRIGTRPVSFKEEVRRDPATDSPILAYRAAPDRIAFVADQAAAWVRLAGKAPAERRIALVLSSYPDREGRLAHAVGLDAPASAVAIAKAMAAAGYDADGFPADGAAPVGTLLDRGADTIILSLDAYCAFLSGLPATARAALIRRRGEPESDPDFADGTFRLRFRQFGNLVVGVQPPRSRDADPKAGYHDGTEVPTHAYLAFYAWMRGSFGADAVVHVGKHGNLEWLPGKALGLSAECWPEIALGPLPLVYPFIVNDPGEGAQAKRRSSAVIVDHMTPPLRRAGAHGAFAELETLIDEYHVALATDPRRRDFLEREILDRAARHGIDRDLGIGAGSGEDERLRAIDAHLCDIKELQIRDGLHELGRSPDGEARLDMLLSIARVPRSGGRPADQSLQQAIAADLGLDGFDPLGCDPATEWTAPKPVLLSGSGVWRTAGDTVERIEALARRGLASVLAGGASDIGPASGAVLGWVAGELATALDDSGRREIDAVLAALDGRFVPPGPSGAPSRGRADVLPTGRNFYAVDTRAVPTEAAWRLGKLAAEALVARYLQDEGEWPRSVAMTAWGTANMRTGGDDIAQLLALIGAEPVWEPGTGRVTGFRVVPLSELGRPRVDVTLRISGLFRDAFPEQIDLIDSAFRALASRDEPADANPIGAARQQPRIFGSAPGTFGAGIEARLDRGDWRSRDELAGDFLGWSGFAYGAGGEGRAEGGALRARLAATDAILHNQDNREHDILDSDEYSQFQGGLAAAVEALRGAPRPVYQGDHSRPERPVVRPLSEEIGRVVRGRAVNPAWIAGCLRHGFRGAAEIANTVDFLFGYAATTHAVGDHHFDALYGAYLADGKVREFLETANPPAFRDMAARFREAIERGLWAPRLNSVHDHLEALAALARQGEPA